MPELETTVSPVPLGTARNGDGRYALTGAAIASVGVALPQRVVTNAPIAERLGVHERWIVERTGIEERRYVGPGENVVTLSCDAVREALGRAGIDPNEIDLVLVATMSHERLVPIAAALVAERIGAVRAGALDIDAACSGFVSGLALAAAQVEAGRARAVLVIGADVLSPLTNRDDRRTAALFADGAGAAVIVANPGPGRIGPVVLGADGAHAELITAEREEALIRMNGHDTFRQAVDRLSEATLAACAAAGVEPGEIDVFAYHQANARILAAVGERLALDPDRIVNCIARHGNSSSATIPLALVEADRAGRLDEGAKVLLGAFGGGLTWAATVVEWGRGHDLEPEVER